MRNKTNLVSLPIIIVACLLITLLAGGCANDRQVISQADQMHTGLQPAVMNEARLNSYLQSIGDRIIAAGKEYDAQHIGPKSHFSEESGWMFSRNMKFHFVNSEQLNAFTTGGEHMYIYNKLFQTAKTEDELAAVMAHEYAHVYCRHVQKGMNRQMAMAGGAVAVSAVAGGGGGSGQDQKTNSPYVTAGLAAAQFVGMGFTRSDEAQADELGFDFYTRAGWDPHKFGDFFGQMIQMGYDKTPALLSDHPTLASRVAKAKERVAALPPAAQSWRRADIADAREFASLQKLASEVARTTPSDKQIANAKKILAAFPRSCWTPGTEDEQQAQEELLKDLKEAQPKERAK